VRAVFPIPILDVTWPWAAVSADSSPQRTNSVAEIWQHRDIDRGLQFLFDALR